MRVPRSLAKFVLIVTFANPQIMLPYARPMTTGAEVGEMNGLAGSRQAQITIPYW